MNIYRLNRIGECDYEECDSQIIIAPSEERAIEIASQQPFTSPQDWVVAETVDLSTEQVLMRQFAN